MSYSKIISFVTGLLMIMPLASVAQTFDQQALIQQLTQQAAKLQARLDQLRQALPSQQISLPQIQSVSSHVLPSPIPQEEDQTATITFDRDLFFGLRNDSDVSNLQEFLTDQGFYTNTISGNFFVLTRNAVKKFQQAHGIKPSGYFGTITRALANNILGGNVLGGSGIPSELHQTRGSLMIDPTSATLKIREDISLKVMFVPSRPACLDNKVHPCRVPERAPYEVYASLTSSNPLVATVGDVIISDCPSPPREIANLCLPHYIYIMRGIAAGSATITASYTNNEGTFTATMQVVVSGNADRTKGSLSLVPPSATLAVGETIKVKAIFTPPRPACLDAVLACKMPERPPYEVDVAFVSSDKSIALTMCPPESGRLTCIGSNGVRGVSAGKAVITTSYNDGSRIFNATMDVTVVGTSPSRGSLFIVPVSVNLAVGQDTEIKAYYQPPMPPCPSGMGCIQVMPPQQEVLASFISDNPNIATVDKIEDITCAPPRMCPVAIRHSVVRGVSAGSAIITATYTNAGETFTATMEVKVSSVAIRPFSL